MPQTRFRLAPGCTVLQPEPGVRMVYSEHGYSVWSDPATNHLLALAERGTVAASLLSLGAFPAATDAALRELVEAGVLHADVPATACQQGAAAFFNRPLPVVAARLRAKHLQILPLLPWRRLGEAWTLHRALGGLGVRSSFLMGASARSWARSLRRRGRPDLVVVLTSDYFDPRLEEVAALMRRRRIAWMPVKPAGYTALIGPLFPPETSPCFTCTRRRLEANDAARCFARGLGSSVVPSNTPLPARRRALDAAAIEISAGPLLEGNACRLKGHLLTLEGRTGVPTLRPIHAFSRTCLHCRPPATAPSPEGADRPAIPHFTGARPPQPLSDQRRRERATSPL